MVRSVVVTVTPAPTPGMPVTDQIRMLVDEPASTAAIKRVVVEERDWAARMVNLPWSGGKKVVFTDAPATSWALLNTMNSVPWNSKDASSKALAVRMILSSLIPMFGKSGKLFGVRTPYTTKLPVGSLL